jgi:hypothetical protein
VQARKGLRSIERLVSSIVEDTLRDGLPQRYKGLMETHNLGKLLEDEDEA